MAGRVKTATFARVIADEEKMAPQMRGIVNCVIAAHGAGNPVTIEQIVAAMEGNITTRQPLERIFGYYAPKLEEAGLITVERSEAAERKPRKAKGEAADGGEDLGGEIGDETDEADDLDDDDGDDGDDDE